MMAIDLPRGWSVVELGAVLDRIVGGGTPSKDNPAYFQGDIPLMTVKDMKVPRPAAAGFNITKEALENSSAKLVPADTLIIATRMGLGKVVRPRMATAINQDLKALFPSEVLDKSYLEKWLISMASKIESMGTGTTVKGIRLNQIREMQFPLAPIDEQRRIVEKIETLFAELDKGEESLRQVQTLLARYRQSVLKAAVTGQLTADWRAENAHRLEHGRDLLARILKARRESWEGRGKYKEPVEPDTTNLPELPEGWVWASLEQLGLIVSGQTPRGIDNHLDDTGTIPWFKVSSMNEPGNEIDLLTSKWTLNEEGARTVKIRLLPKGAIVFPKRGGAIMTNKKRRLGCLAAIDLNLMGFVPVSLADYVWVFFQRLDLRAIYDGSNVPQINYRDVADLPIAVPSSDTEALLIASIVDKHLEQIGCLEEMCRAELLRSKGLRQSILKDAFSGKLVPQDPNDEPAAELLARIKAGRAAKPKQSHRSEMPA